MKKREKKTRSSFRVNKKDQPDLSSFMKANALRKLQEQMSTLQTQLTLHPRKRSTQLKHAHFWDADGNRKRTFPLLGPYCLPDFYTTHL